MVNLLRTSIYSFLQTKVFKTIISLHVFYAFVIFAMFVSVKNGFSGFVTSPSPTVLELVLNMMLVSMAPVCTSWAYASFLSNELKYGKISLSSLKGYSKKDIYFSHLILNCACVLCFGLVEVITITVCGIFIFPFGSPPKDAFLILFIILLVNFGWVAFTTMLETLACKSQFVGFSLSIYFVAGTVLYSLNLLFSFVFKDIHLENYWVTTCLNTVKDISAEVIIRCILVSVSSFLLFSFLGLRNFCKKDVPFIRNTAMVNNLIKGSPVAGAPMAKK